MGTRYNRLIENYLQEIMRELPAFAIDGLKGVGKTDTATALAQTVFNLDFEADRLLLQNNVNRLLRAKKPILLDEWQRLPSVWDFVRRAVDMERVGGSYLLTGSASAKNLDIHSGAGRIIRLRMFPLSLQERGLERPTVSLEELFSQNPSSSLPIEGDCQTGFEDYLREIALSGLPALRIESPRTRRLAIGSYLDNLLTHDFEQEGIRIRQPQMLRRWLASYASAVASTAAYNLILDRATPGDTEKPAAKTTIAYREALQRLWLIDELPTWLDGEAYARLKKTPKHFVADPAFVLQLLSIDLDGIIKDASRTLPESRFDERYGNIVGRLFEALIYQSIRVYASVNDAEVGYFHTHRGEREIDFIVTQGAKTIAIEVKATPSVEDGDVRHLVWLRDAMKGRLTDALVINTGPVAYRRPDGIAVVPAALLGA